MSLFNHLKFALLVLLAANVTSADTLPANTIGTIVELDFNQGITDGSGNFVDSIQIGLYDSAAPQTVANFLQYVNSGEYNDTIIHRSVPGFVIQGGGYTATVTGGTVSSLNPINSFGTIPNEFNPSNSNVAGTIAMALSGNPADPNSATSQWFINTADNSGNPNNLDAQDFTVFGQVLGNGMELVNAINGLTTQDLNSYYDPNYPADGDSGPFSEVPLVPPSNTFIGVTNAFVVAVPEPPSAVLVAVAIAVFVGCVWLRRRLSQN